MLTKNEQNLLLLIFLIIVYFTWKMNNLEEKTMEKFVDLPTMIDPAATPKLYAADAEAVKLLSNFAIQLSNGGTTVPGNVIFTGGVTSNSNITATAGTGVITGKTITATGDINATAGTVAAKDITATGNITTTTGRVTAKDITATGAVNVTGAITAGGLASSGSVNITGSISATSNITAATINATGAVSTGALTSSSITTTGPVSTGALTTTSENLFIGNNNKWTIHTPNNNIGTISFAHMNPTADWNNQLKYVNSTRTLMIGNLTAADSITAPDGTITGKTITGKFITATGAINAATITTTGAINADTITTTGVVSTGELKPASITTTGNINAITTGSGVITGNTVNSNNNIIAKWNIDAGNDITAAKTVYSQSNIAYQNYILGSAWDTNIPNALNSWAIARGSGVSKLQFWPRINNPDTAAAAKTVWDYTKNLIEFDGTNGTINSNGLNVKQTDGLITTIINHIGFMLGSTDWTKRVRIWADGLTSKLYFTRWIGSDTGSYDINNQIEFNTATSTITCKEINCNRFSGGGAIGAWMINGGSGGIPIISSIKNYDDYYNFDNKDDQYIVMPGYKLVVYQDNEWKKNYVTITNTNGVKPMYISMKDKWYNTGSSCKLFYKDQEITMELAFESPNIIYTNF